MNKIESQKERNRERNKQRYHEDEEYRTNKNEKDNRRNKKRYRTDEQDSLVHFIVFVERYNKT